MDFRLFISILCLGLAVHGLGDFDYQSLADKESNAKPLFLTQKVDHFSFTSNKTYQQKYFVRDDFWKPGGPIIFYLGSESALHHPKTGFTKEVAKEFGALMVDAEHRFYGDSQPFGKPLVPNTQQDPAVAGYLTSWQALADYAGVINHVKLTIPGAENSPVIAFGESYGGMLSAWMRVKYPHLVDGAISSSAPMLQNSMPGSSSATLACSIDAEKYFPWWIQTCLEMAWTHDEGEVMSYPCKGVSVADYSANCQEIHNVTPSFFQAKINYGEDKLKYASNIVFSNGGEDHWAYWGIREDINPSTVAIFLPHGTHCADLYPTSSVNEEAHRMERIHIKKWIEEANRKSQMK